MTTYTWFPRTDYTSLEIKKYKSIANDRVMKSALITDPAIIERVMARIEAIPANGEVKVVFDNKADKMDLRFSNGADILLIEIYDKRFKTPSSCFHTSNNDIEVSLYEDIDTLLHPNRKKKFAKLAM